MDNTITGFSETMAKLRKVVEKDGKEIEYWSAREIHEELGYDKWDNFLDVIGKAKQNCSSIGVKPMNHLPTLRKWSWWVVVG